MPDKMIDEILTDEFDAFAFDTFGVEEGTYSPVSTANGIAVFAEERKKFRDFIVAAKKLGFDKGDIIVNLLGWRIKSILPILHWDDALDIAGKEYEAYEACCRHNKKAEELVDVLFYGKERSNDAR